MGWKDIFSAITTKGSETATQQASVSVSSSVNNTNNRGKDETYVQYGSRICGLVSADINSLNPFLQKVYASEYQRFATNKEYQDAHKIDLQNKIAQKNAEKEKVNNEISADNNSIGEISKNIQEWQGNITKLKSNDHESNKEAFIKMYLGLGILILLTVYLFIFYSSTFYSAVFKDFIHGNTEIGAAMFDSSALRSAWTDGISELIFICTAPIIFMALGYALHFFNDQKGWGKYLKSGGCILITFLFDCILAYLIGKKLYDIEVMSTLTPMPPYSIGEALTDGNIWAVIFCGFITYMIWGVVLDMTLTAYNELKFNKGAIQKLQNKIAQAQTNIGNLQKNIVKLKNDLAQIASDITKLNNELSKVFVPCTEIKIALNDFFAGWAMLAGVLDNPDYDAEQAKSIFDTFVSNIEDK